MRATMTRDGVLEIEPQTGAEAFALRKFIEESYVAMRDEKLNESGHFRGSKINIQLGTKIAPLEV